MALCMRLILAWVCVSDCNLFNHLIMLLTLIFAGLLGQPSSTPPSSLVPLPPKTGTGILLGAQTSMVNQEDFKLGFGPTMGFYHFRDLSERVTLQIELQGRLVSGYKETTYLQDNVLNPNGLSVSHAEFYLRSLFFVELPILLKFRKNQQAKHSWFVGCRPSINRITNHSEGSIGSTIANGAQPYDYSGLSMRKAVCPADIGLIGGWSYRFNSRLGLDIRYTQGFIDLTADNFFQNTTTALNSELQVSLRANF